MIFVLNGKFENKNLRRKLTANRRNVKIFVSRCEGFFTAAPDAEIEKDYSPG
jgi:hypothetical protein